jgi:hypothetical protein
MKCLLVAALFAPFVVLPAAHAAEPGLIPVESVEIGPRREFQVNGQPFFPLMAWLQDPGNFAAMKECGMNATAGYWKGSGGTADVVEYMQHVQRAGCTE